MLREKLIWEPQKYYDLSIAQKKASEELINLLEINENDHIIDIGCGDGNITAKLSKIASLGFVLGIDISKEMISYASRKYTLSEYNNLTFKKQDAQYIKYKNQFNIVFSSFTLQWIKDKNTFFKHSYKSLKNNGYIAITMPLCISPELKKSVNNTISMKQWKKFFIGFQPPWHFCKSSEVKNLLRDNGFNLKYCYSYIQNVIFPSKEAFEKYVMLWFCYTNYIPNQLKKSFLKEVFDRYFDMLPVTSEGLAVMRIPQINVIGNKVTF